MRRALGATAARTAGYWFYFGVSIGAPIRRACSVPSTWSPCSVPTAAGSSLIVVLGDPRATVPRQQLRRASPSGSDAVRPHRSAAGWHGDRRGRPRRPRPPTPANFTPFPRHRLGTESPPWISLFVWAFAGWEGGRPHRRPEFRNPRRTIPLATGDRDRRGRRRLPRASGGHGRACSAIGPGRGTGAAGSTSSPLRAPGAGPLIVAVVAGPGLRSVCLNTYLAAFSKLGASLGRDGDLPAFPWPAESSAAEECRAARSRWSACSPPTVNFTLLADERVPR